MPANQKHCLTKFVCKKLGVERRRHETRCPSLPSSYTPSKGAVTKYGTVGVDRIDLGHPTSEGKYFTHTLKI